MQKFEYAVKNYDWGSTDYLNDFLHDTYFANKDANPKVAEVWFGAHKEGDGLLENGLILSDYISQNAVNALGRERLERFGPVLPYLLKLIAISKNLSIQVHPIAQIARRGFNKEQREKVPFNSSLRTFKDTNAKREMLFAITKSQVAVGFAERGTILARLEGLSSSLIQQILEKLNNKSDNIGLQLCLEFILSLNDDVKTEQEFQKLYAEIEQRYQNDASTDPLCDEIFLRASRDFELKDSTALVLMLMNCSELEPNQSVYLEAGEIHCYHRGFGLEIMANSDNVIRGGLTPKHIDKSALANATMFIANSNHQTEANLKMLSRSPKVFSLTPEIWDFALTVGHLQSKEVAQSNVLPTSGPRILVCVSGSLICKGKNGAELSLKIGESIFIDDADSEIEITAYENDTLFAIGWCG